MRINFKFLAVVVVVLALVGGSLFGLNRFQASRSADILLTQAREAKESEDFAEAIRLYKQFLGFRPREAAVHEELGMLMADVGQFQPAYFHLETALRANPQNLEAQEKLVEVSIALGRNTDAKTRLNEQLLSQDDKNPKYQWLLGLCESSLGNSAEAKEYFTLAVEGAPGEPAYVGALANLLPTQEAKEKMDAMVEAGKDNPLCYFVRSNWLLQNPAANVETEESPQDLAWQDALQAHRLDGEDVRFVLLVSQAAIARQQVAEARDIVAKAIEAKPNLAELYSSAAQIELADGDVDSAMKCYERGLTALPKQTELIWGLAQLELDAGNIEAAKGRAQELRKLKYPDSALSFLDARILVAESKWRQAADLLEKSRALMDQNKDLLKQADFLLAGCYQQLGKADQEALVLRRALAIDPQWLPARQALANSLTRSGRIGEAISQLRQVVGSGNASPTAQLSLARLMFLDGRGADKADWTQLRKLLTHLEQFPELANDVAVIRAELLVNENKPAEAVQLLRDALKTSDNKQGLWQALVGLQVRNEQWDEAEATLEAAAAALSDDVPLRLEQARFLIRRDGPEVDIDRLKQLATPNTDWTEEQKSQLAYGFAGFFLSLEEYELCEEYAKIAAVAEQGQASLPIHLLLFDLALRSQDAKAMSDSLEKVKEIEGTGPLWRVGEAVRLMITAQDENNDEEKGRLYAQANQQLAEAAVERPDWARIPRLQGDIFDQQGKTEQAVDSYLKAIELGEQNIDVVSRAISLLSAKGRYLDADKVIRKMQEQSNPFSSELNRVASQVSVQLQDYERALSFSEGWATKSDKQEDHVFLAQVYRSTGKIAEAEQELRVALDLDPTSPAAWVTLVQLYYDANDFDAASKTIDEAKLKIRPEDVDNAIAQCYELIKNFELAEQSYQRALEQDPDNPTLMVQLAAFYLKSGGAERARPLLERLEEGELATEDRDQRWARRNLALYLGTTGDEEEFARAKSLIDENLSQAEDVEQDQRALAVILAARPEKEYVSQAADILKKLIEAQEARQSPSYQDKFMLAQIYRRRNDWNSYSRTMFSVLGQASGQPDYVRYVQNYYDALMTQDRKAEAKPWLDQLEKLAPDQISTATSEAIFLYRAKDYKRLFAMLETKSKQSKEYVGWAAELSENFARGLSGEGENSEAEKFLEFSKQLYADIAASEPNGKLIQAAFYARLGDIDETLRILASEQPTPDQLAEIAQTALQSGELSDTQLQQLQATLQQTFLKDTGEKNLGMCLGDLYSWGGDWKSAVATYRGVLKADPKHIPALNNMAMVLAMTGEQLNEAIKVINEAIRLSGPRDYLLDTRGIVLLATGAKELAERDFLTAIETAANGYRYFHLAQALQALGRTDEARAALQKALEGGVSASTVHPLERAAFEKLLQQLLPVE